MNKKIAKKKTKNESSMQVYTLKIIIGVVVIFMLLIGVLISVMLRRTEVTVKRQMASVISSNTYQQTMNVDNYMKKMEDINSLFFSEEDYYKYDETLEDLSGEEKSAREAKIQSRIEELSIQDSFADFCVVYADNYKLGWVADNTYEIEKGSKFYAAFSKFIEGEDYDGLWVASPKNNYRSFYYIKRLNPNAIIITSFYSRDLDSVFEVPIEMDGMIMRITDENFAIIYSTNEKEIGTYLNEDIKSLIAGSENCTVFNSKYLVTSNMCGNEKWKVVCSLPAENMMKEMKSLRNYMLFIASALFAIVVALALILRRRVSEPLSEMLEGLEKKANYDRLTGLLNKMSFQDVVTAFMDSGKGDSYNIFIMIDMDNFKKINDNLGHDAGDDVLKKISNLMKSGFGDDYMIGRLGGDEFAFYKQSEDEKAHIERRIKMEMEYLQREFADEFANENKKFGLSVSLGIAVIKGGEMNFDEIYKAADTALYVSKKGGKNQYRFFSEAGVRNE